MSKDIFLKISSINFILGPIFYCYMMCHDCFIPHKGIEKSCGLPLHFLGIPFFIGGFVLAGLTIKFHNKNKGVPADKLQGQQRDYFIFFCVAASIYIFFTCAPFFKLLSHYLS